MWRAEFHECGWASRWYVVRGYFDAKQWLRSRRGFFADFTQEADAQASADLANRVSPGLDGVVDPPPISH
jgi:hypothetical protein